LLQTGQIVEFTAKEFWKENYATKGGKEKSIAPNAMWTKRPYGQIAKCAEGQALRKAFPEVGSHPTADEMEGKTFDIGDVVDVPTKTPAPQSLPAYQEEEFQKKLTEWQKVIDSGKKTPGELLAFLTTKATIDESQKARILSMKKAAANKAEDPKEHDQWIDELEQAEGEQQ
jgi:hypothetical protein